VSAQPYYVKQLPNAALGYSVLAYDPSTMPGVHPSFNAFQLRIDPAAAPLQASLSTDTGGAMPTSVRQINVVNADSSWSLLVPGAIVVGFGLMYRLRRQWSTRARRTAAGTPR
jgi:hypothetical protein